MILTILKYFQRMDVWLIEMSLFRYQQCCWDLFQNEISDILQGTTNVLPFHIRWGSKLHHDATGFKTLQRSRAYNGFRTKQNMDFGVHSIDF